MKIMKHYNGEFPIVIKCECGYITGLCKGVSKNSFCPSIDGNGFKCPSCAVKYSESQVQLFLDHYIINEYRLNTTPRAAFLIRDNKEVAW